MTINDWVLQVDPIEKACKLAKLLGCQDTSNHEHVYETLINAPATEITRQANHTVSEDEKRRSLIMPFRPVIEKLNNVDAFVTEHPLKTLKQNDILLDIPIITVSKFNGISVLD